MAPHVVLACPGDKGPKVKKTVTMVKQSKDAVSFQFTTKDGVDATKKLQAKFDGKVKAYNAGKKPCAKCKSDRCVFRVDGLKFKTKKMTNGIQFEAKGTPKSIGLLTSALKAQMAGKASNPKPASGCGGCGGAAKKGSCGGGKSNVFRAPML
tara:strand:+ start:254 stop:709 length:456 start_codon:yes stop_codon:yes gene_type:complete